VCPGCGGRLRLVALTDDHQLQTPVVHPRNGPAISSRLAEV